ncbi:hypothetical protein BH24GEM2_BH24GEM2_08740 [soil metagenome]
MDVDPNIHHLRRGTPGIQPPAEVLRAYARSQAEPRGGNTVAKHHKSTTPFTRCPGQPDRFHIPRPHTGKHHQPKTTAAKQFFNTLQRLPFSPGTNQIRP